MVSTPKSELSGVAAVLKRFQRIITWFETNWAAGEIVRGWLPAGMGGLAMGWLASISEFLAPYAPVSYGAAGLLGMLVVAICLALVGMFRSYMAEAEIKKAAATSVKSVNYLDDYFSRVAVKISDFEPIFGPYNGKKFVDCDIIGPAVLTLTGQFNFEGTHWGRTDVIIASFKETRISTHNSIILHNSSFVRCRFYSITRLIGDNDEPVYRKLLAEQNVDWIGAQ